MKNVFGVELEVIPGVTNRYGQNLAQLKANHAESVATLKAQGFTQVCSVVAGLDSGSVWTHPAGDSAEIQVRTGNLIKYSDIGAMWTREHGPELAAKLLAIRV